MSDIHGVLPVLDAVLAEPVVRDPELVVVTGDHASGPQPGQVLNRLLAEGDRLRLVRGNADRELVDRRLVINAGSIGMPYGHSGGSWALLHNGAVSLHHTPIDIDDAVSAVIDGSTYPDRRARADEYVRATNSDTDAIVAFTPAEDRPGTSAV